MDCKRVGELIYGLRKEKGMTQSQLAEKLNISDKAISKWERGLGCPDVSLLNQLSDVLGVNIENILSGNMDANDYDGGNMKKLRFYVCNNCNNILTSTADAEITCCGRKLSPLVSKISDNVHHMTVEIIEDNHYITLNHEMTRDHYISFVACVSCDKVLIVKLYPEQNAEVQFPKIAGGKLYAYCNQHGLWEKTNYNCNMTKESI